MDQSNIPTNSNPSFPPSSSVPPVKPDYFSFPQSPPVHQPVNQFSSTPSSPAPSLTPTPPPISSVLPPSGFTQPLSQPPITPNKSPLGKILVILLILILLGGAAYLIITVLGKNKLSLGRKTVTLTYWGLFEPTSVFQQVIDDYQKEHPGVKINYTQENLKQYRERLQAALERKEGPDIFRIHQSWTPMLGTLLSPVPQTVFTTADYEKTFYASAKETLKFNGQYVAVPLMVDGLALFYNEDIFSSNGKTPPKTWGDLKKLACQLTVKDEQGKIRTAGVALGTTNNIDHWSDILALMILQNGADPANPAVCTGATEADQTCLGRDALSFYTLFASDQICADEGVDVGSVWNSLQPSSTYAFATGNVAMYFGSSWRAFDIKGINSKLNFKVVSVPQLPGGVVNWSSYWVEAVSKQSVNQAEAWDFVRYLSSQKVMEKLYQTESSLRLFGEPYSRTDMAAQLRAQPVIGPFIDQASFAKNWYLSSNTADNGINTKIIKYYEDTVNAVNQGQDPLLSLKTATSGISQVLRQYGLTR